MEKAEVIKNPIQMGQKEQIIRQWFTGKFGTEVPSSSVRELFTDFQVDLPGEKLSYGLFNGVFKKIEKDVKDGTPVWEGEVSVTVEPIKKLNVQAINLDDMNFPDFKLFRSGKYIDRLMSDDTEEGGLYSGTATIVIGESGVGKTTVLLDLLASIKRENPESDPCYLSSEMTKNDLYFYKKKTPIIGQVPTILLMDYIEEGITKVVEAVLLDSKHDVIVVDSYQDIIVKLTDIFGMRAKQAEAWLTSLIIKACEERGKSIFAIQHLTKSGTYVGSTYLKHATTAMMEIRKDTAGGRYIEYSKNRRGGALVDHKLYYSLVNGEVQYDELSFRDSKDAHNMKEKEVANRHKATEDFDAVFHSIANSAAKETDGVVDVEFEELETDENLDRSNEVLTPEIKVIPNTED